jgi:hypothetical protein
MERRGWTVSSGRRWQFRAARHVDAPSLQVVAESNHRWERSEAMIDNRLPEMSSERFLRHNVGRAFCESCLAIHTGLSLQQAAAAVAALGQLSEFVVGSARCLSCGRTNALISATTS